MFFKSTTLFILCLLSVDQLLGMEQRKEKNPIIYEKEIVLERLIQTTQAHENAISNFATYTKKMDIKFNILKQIIKRQQDIIEEQQTRIQSVESAQIITFILLLTAGIHSTNNGSRNVGTDY